MTQSGQICNFSVFALHNSYISTQSRSLSVNIPNCGAPTFLASSFNSNCDISLTWSIPQNRAIAPTSYNIYDANNNFIVSTSNLSYTFLNQNSEHTYSYIVKACHNQYEGPNGASTSSNMFNTFKYSVFI